MAHEQTKYLRSAAERALESMYDEIPPYSRELAQDLIHAALHAMAADLRNRGSVDIGPLGALFRSHDDGEIQWIGEESELFPPTDSPTIAGLVIDALRDAGL